MAGDAGTLLNEIDDLADGGDTVSVKDVVDAIGGRGFGPIIFVTALLGASPLGGIPGVPTLFAIILILIAVQILFGRRSFWMPDRIGNRAVTDDRVARSVDKARPAAEWMDRHFGHRLEALTGRPAQLAAALVVVGLCAMIPPLEVVPFAALIPFAAIALLGLAITVRDGVLMVVAFAASAGALFAAIRFLPF
ncbi:Exopolysaccharide synthesis, ExoD [Roseovarius sp. THAF27]|uniref:exopolysaccharide biosynthesis protein n=1 Tax=unclassified Roseovarius TaxID=2614913 RepID=UPI0012684F5B|nr:MULTISPECIES: exopolysaccharide biosynthesis protein [unclassified Roseovarius]QFT79295.1 Exopolysaccharide synthesis, ExoD [Roseovarius sp. THAF27]QFT97535.1 Exopolysaccharide synthesis, ExoD [Roseovarius sp. THAF8]